MSKGLGKRQRDILARLAQHRDHPPDYNAQLGWWIRDKEQRQRYIRCYTDRYPEWMTVAELTGKDPHDSFSRRSSDIESTRQAVRRLEAAGLVETLLIHRNERGQCQLGVRLRGDHVG